MQVDEIQRRVYEVAANCFAYPIDQLTPETRLVEDLGSESLDDEEFAMALEDAFSIDPKNSQIQLLFHNAFSHKPVCLKHFVEAIAVHFRPRFETESPKPTT